MFGLGATELIVILVIALVIFGPGKLPELGSALGRGIRDFRKSVDGIEDKETDDHTGSETPPDRSA
jgi:sec-independent protein translocase protein TatA